MKIIQILFSLFLLSCNSTEDQNKMNGEDVPDIFATNYNKFKDRKFKLSFGDLVKISCSENKGIICDISIDEGGIWYGIVFLKDSVNLFGRRIPSGFGQNNCVSLYDFTYLNENALSSLSKISSLDLDYNKIGIGSREPARNCIELERNFLDGIQRRKLIETKCEDKLKNLNPVNETYRNLKEISLTK